MPEKGRIAVSGSDVLRYCGIAVARSLARAHLNLKMAGILNVELKVACDISF